MPRTERFLPNSPTVTRYTACNGMRVELPSNRQTLNFPSVFQFVADHTICRYKTKLDSCEISSRKILFGTMRYSLVEADSI